MKTILTKEQRDFLITYDIAFNPYKDGNDWVIIIPNDFECPNEYTWIYECPLKE